VALPPCHWLPLPQAPPLSQLLLCSLLRWGLLGLGFFLAALPPHPHRLSCAVAHPRASRVVFLDTPWLVTPLLLFSTPTHHCPPSRTRASHSVCGLVCLRLRALGLAASPERGPLYTNHVLLLPPATWRFFSSSFHTLVSVLALAFYLACLGRHVALPYCGSTCAHWPAPQHCLLLLGLFAQIPMVLIIVVFACRASTWYRARTCSC